MEKELGIGELNIVDKRTLEDREKTPGLKIDLLEREKESLFGELKSLGGGKDKRGSRDKESKEEDNQRREKIKNRLREIKAELKELKNDSSEFPERKGEAVSEIAREETTAKETVVVDSVERKEEETELEKKGKKWEEIETFARKEFERDLEKGKPLEKALETMKVGEIIKKFREQLFGGEYDKDIKDLIKEAGLENSEENLIRAKNIFVKTYSEKLKKIERGKIGAVTKNIENEVTTETTREDSPETIERQTKEVKYTTDDFTKAQREAEVLKSITDEKIEKEKYLTNLKKEKDQIIRELEKLEEGGYIDKDKQARMEKELAKVEKSIKEKEEKIVEKPEETPEIETEEEIKEMKDEKLNEEIEKVKKLLKEMNPENAGQMTGSEYFLEYSSYLNELMSEKRRRSGEIERGSSDKDYAEIARQNARKLAEAAVKHTGEVADLNASNEIRDKARDSMIEEIRKSSGISLVAGINEIDPRKGAEDYYKATRGMLGVILEWNVKLLEAQTELTKAQTETYKNTSRAYEEKIKKIISKKKEDGFWRRFKNRFKKDSGSNENKEELRAEGESNMPKEVKEEVISILLKSDEEKIKKIFDEDENKVIYFGKSEEQVANAIKELGEKFKDKYSEEKLKDWIKKLILERKDFDELFEEEGKEKNEKQEPEKETKEITEEMKGKIRKGLEKLKNNNKNVFSVVGKLLENENYLKSESKCGIEFGDDVSKGIMKNLGIEISEIENIKVKDFVFELKKIYDEVKKEKE